MGESTSPISVILVSSGSRGNKLLFRFPFQRGAEHPAAQDSKCRRRELRLPRARSSECFGGVPFENCNNFCFSSSRFSDVILATILATKSDMCGKKFELKIDNVRFVGHPTLLQHALGQVRVRSPLGTCLLHKLPGFSQETWFFFFFFFFFFLANADPSVFFFFFFFFFFIAIVLQHEERFFFFFFFFFFLILAIQDEVSSVIFFFFFFFFFFTEGPQSPFHHILPKCKLARDLKETYDSLCTIFFFFFFFFFWLEVSFCLPHNFFFFFFFFFFPEAIERSLKSFFFFFFFFFFVPYFFFFFFFFFLSLLNELPLDCFFFFFFFFFFTSAVKNLQQLVFQLAAHLVYWGKAIIIYPLCENNVYMLSPNASHFPCDSLLTKCTLCVVFLLDLTSQLFNPWCLPLQTQLIQMVIWMLQHRLLIQLHTYVCLMVPPNEEELRAQDEDMPFTARVGGRSLSTPNALSFGSPTSSDDMTLTSPSMDNSSAELIPGGDSPLNKRMTENLLASLLEHEREAILNVPAAQNPEDLRMFARLLHYFRGRHHLEEIMYNENMRRSQLLMLFDKFRSVLVVTSHEDPVISVFQSLLK
ncbi:NPRL3 protein, partial [Chloropsis hardwickii]|nr:NPRL3 protein [Chloropsis hardwickii]